MIAKFNINFKQILFYGSVIWFFLFFLLLNLIWYEYQGKYEFPFFETPLGISNASTWLPLASKIAFGDSFLEIIFNEKNNFFPYFSIIIYGLLIKVFGAVEAFTILQVLLPTLSFVLLIKIYNIFIPLRWSLVLSALGMLAFSSIDLRFFILNIINGLGWRDFMQGEPYGASITPFPSISLFFFLLAFFITFHKKVFLSNFRMFFLTFLWSIQIYFHAINFFLGMPLWFFVLLIWHLKDKRQFSKTLIISRLVFQLIFSMIICLPILYNSTGFINLDNYQYFGLYSSSTLDLNISSYYFLVYFILPIFLMLLSFLIFKIDYYEILLKFWPIYFLMFIELTFVLLKVFTGIGLQPTLFFDRIGKFFLHLFYYVPPLYYLTKSWINYDEFNYFKKFISNFFVHHSKVYIPIVFLILSFFCYTNLVSSNKVLSQSSASYKKNQKILNFLVLQGKEGETLVSNDFLTNFIFPTKGNYNTLLMSRSVLNISLDENLERILLWWKITQSSRENLKLFLTPSNQFSQNRYDNFFKNYSDLHGIGFWLCMGRTSLNDEEMQKFIEKSLIKYDNLDVQKLILKYKIKNYSLPENTKPMFFSKEIGQIEDVKIYKVLEKELK